MRCTCTHPCCFNLIQHPSHRHIATLPQSPPPLPPPPHPHPHSPQELFLDGNKIKTVDRGGLHGLRRLRILSLERNLVRTVPGLSGMQTLAKVNLSHNRIMETGEVERLVGLTALRDLDMAANPIARRATHRVSWGGCGGNKRGVVRERGL